MYHLALLALGRRMTKKILDSPKLLIDSSQFSLHKQPGPYMCFCKDFRLRASAVSEVPHVCTGTFVLEQHWHTGATVRLWGGDERVGVSWAIKSSSAHMDQVKAPCSALFLYVLGWRLNTEFVDVCQAFYHWAEYSRPRYSILWDKDQQKCLRSFV